MSQTPAGWYPEPAGGLRWWDGERWTEHRAPAPAGPTPAQARRSHLPLIWAGVAFIALAAVVVVAVVLLRGDGDDGPTRTIEAFIAATNEADCAAAADYLTDEMSDASTTEADCQATDDEGNALRVAFTAREVTVRGDTATVRGSLHDLAGDYRPDEWQDLVFTLVREDGQWFIDDLQVPDGEDLTVE